MKISVFGIGYVGAVTSACLADSGHSVIAVDPSRVKVDCLREGRSPIVEKGLEDLLKKGVDSGRLEATDDYRSAVMRTDMSLVCVGTPGRHNNAPDLTYVENACRQIGETLRDKTAHHTVVIRSTVVPGTLRGVVVPALEKASGKISGKDFSVGNNPEFMREGSAIDDYYNPSQIVVGATDEETGKRIMSIYNNLDAPRALTDVDVAESVKYVSNAWRANKISFANEIGNILKRHGVDSHKVMRIIFEDRKINLGPSFMMPGYAFGGSCLPKDVRALRASANDKGLETPLFDSMLTANNLQVAHAYKMVLDTGKKDVALLGLSFKPGTDDLRESALVALADLLLRNGFNLRIYDPCVSAARRMNGANKSCIEDGLSHISRCLVDTPAALAGSGVYVIGNATPPFCDVIDGIEENAAIVDLVRYEPAQKRAAYAGICW